ncbi:hypothetical protein OZX72_05275 [Bifidobacterium sp. ESL0769]|uniref:hypothetical protein n=1 Tax=Bifidobacterium sp. ESL0769 TaxID=2983229 RepID=UPI0023F71246|nr:hypothetical protein [Bifidobacterium sp. ESL0769]WEV66685.1 hypothetical protein OZX72_05275 [Bifidobacterium sp. ESL0769]
MTTDAFAVVSPSITWDRLSGPGTDATVAEEFPNTAALAARVSTSSNPEGIYVDRTLPGLILEVDPNGGTTETMPIIVDTSTGPKTLTVPQAEVLRTNKPHSLFDKWTDDQGNTVAQRQAITLRQGEYSPRRVMVVHAQWRAITPRISTPKTHVASNGDTTFDVTATDASKLTSGLNHEWDCSNGTCTVTGESVVGLQPNPGAQYSLTASSTNVTDPNTHNTVSGGSVTQTGYLPYAKVEFNANGGTGAPTGFTAFADSTSGHTVTAISTSSIPTKGPHDVFTGWAENAAASNPDATYNPGKTLAGTTIAGKSTTLYAIWHTVAAPSISASRNGDNTVSLTATSKPMAMGDKIHYCIQLTAGGTQSCWDDTVGAGTWDGNTTHQSTHIIPQADIPRKGHYDLSATLTTSDPWRTAGSVVTSATTETSVLIQGLYAHALPFTGGPRWRMFLLLLAIGIMLIATKWLHDQKQRTAISSRDWRRH